MGILVGDIGATNTRLVIFEDDDIVFRHDSRTADIKRFSVHVNDFLREAGFAGHTANKAVFAVAGPHDEYSITLHNQDLTISVSSLLNNTALEYVTLVNDVYCVAQHSGSLVISVGTGLGVSLPDRPLEAGHLLFPADKFSSLIKYVKDQIHRPVEYEHLLSGQGWVYMYQYLRNSEFSEAADLQSAEQISEDFSECKNASVSLFKDILELFCSQIVLATESDSVVVCGGVVQKNPELVHGLDVDLIDDADITLRSALSLL